MLSVRWHARRDVRLEEVEFAGSLPPGQIEAEVSFCGICGSDVAEFKDGPFAIRHRPHPLTGSGAPVTLGHEFSARVVAVGEGVTRLAPGDRIAADACWRCGECDACRAGRYNQCRLGGSIGLASDGAFAPLVRIPAYCAVALPDGVSDRAGALLEPLSVGLHALTRGGAQPGEAVAVLGFGAIGAATAVVAQAVGLDVIVSEPNPDRARQARALGFATIDATGDKREVAAEVRRCSPQGLRLVVDASGAAAALSTALELTVRGGVVVVVGIPKTTSDVDGARLVLFERSIVGALGYVNDLPRVANLIAGGHLDPERLISKTIALADVPSEIERLADRPNEDLKVLVDVRGAGTRT